MRIILPQDFEYLKTLTLSTAQISHASPSGCKVLSNKISQKTNKQISDTTLKRIFGFANNNVQPSLYTLNTLAEFCGYKYWEDFCNKRYSERQPVANEAAVDDLPGYAYKVTLNTLQALKNSSGISFPLTIPRESVNQHLEMFFKSEFPITILTAPAGFGKTIGICHWVSQKIDELKSTASSEILLFLSSKVMNQVVYQDNLYAWLLSLIGLKINDGNITKLNVDEIGDRPITLIIDGFDHAQLNSKQFMLLFSLLQDVIAVRTACPRLKIILTIHSATWTYLKKRLEIEGHLDQWYQGFMQDNLNEINMPLFDINEIETLYNKLHKTPLKTNEMHIEAASLFKYPNFFQYYYQSKHKNFDLQDIDFFGIYEIVSSYITDKIYTSNYPTEKLLLIRTFLEKGKFRNDKFIIYTIDVYEEIKIFRNAYDDLISIGFLIENNRSSDKGYEDGIEFAHRRILNLCFARHIVFDNNELYDENLIKTISTKFDHNYRLGVLKGCIYHAIKNGTTAILDHIHLIELTASEKEYLIKFLSNLLQKTYGSPDGATESFDKERPFLFSYLLGFEFISAEYEQSLRGLLKLNLTDASYIWLHTCIGVINIIQLNSVGVEESIKELRKYPQHAYQTFPINPLWCIEALYYYMKFGIIKTEALKQITAFCFNPPAPSRSGKEIGSNYVLYLLAVSVITIANNPQKKLRFIKTLQNINNSNKNFSPQFHYFLLITLGDTYLSLNKNKEALEIYDLLANGYDFDKRSSTPYMKACFDYFSITMYRAVPAKFAGQQNIDELAQSLERSPFKILSINSISLYLAANKAEIECPYYNTLYLNFIKQMRSNAFNPRYVVLNYQEIFDVANR